MNLQNIIPHFKIEGVIKNALPIGSGHIHQSFRLVNADLAAPDYFLQQINHQVFQNAERLTSNIVNVCSHLNSVFEKGNHYKSLQPIAANDGKYFFKDGTGKYWRAFIFEKDLRSFDTATSNDQIYEAAKAFGKFLAALMDFPAADLQVTIPGFHSLTFRMQQLNVASLANPAARLATVQRELRFIQSSANELLYLERAGLPIRITHNDTKLNNVLFDHAGHARCVVDLDTVMPGFVLYDFGDGIRTTISTAAEDEADLANINIDISRFEAFKTGYLEATHKLLTTAELNSLRHAPALLALLMGVRFLTDYIRGDVYYKIDHEAHNLQRSRAQLELCRKLMKF